jgi:hypothetical protein
MAVQSNHTAPSTLVAAGPGDGQYTRIAEGQQQCNQMKKHAPQHHMQHHHQQQKIEEEHWPDEQFD